MNPVESIDYIFDRYAYLNLTEEASMDEIKKSIRLKRAENHPDKLTHLSAEMKNIADRNNGLIASCERILLVPELKELFDQKLQHFKQESPYLVSTDGHAIIDVTRFRVNVAYLLSDEYKDVSEIEAKAQQMTGYNPKRVEKLKTRYAADPEDQDNKEDYKEALTCKLVYINVMEDFYWQQAGVHGACQKHESVHVQSLDDVHALLEKKIKNAKEGAAVFVQEHQRSSLLGFAEPLLLTYQNNEALPLNNETHHALVLKAHEKLELNLDNLKKLIDEKKEVLFELCKLTEYTQVHIGNSNTSHFLLAQRDEEGQVSLMGFGSTVNTEDSTAEVFEGDVPDFGNLNDYPDSIYLVFPNKEIESPILELMTLVNRLLSDKK